MGLFNGLDQFGLGKLEKMNVFEEEKQKEAEPGKEPENKVSEADLLFDKKFDCPVCDSSFQSKVVRTGKIKLVSSDTDLRPKYQLVDPLKYDAVVCPKCGYASLSRFYKDVSSAQAGLIKENISSNFRGLPETGDIYTYDDALLRHQLALANTVVKKARPSEKAYTCLKMAWLCRGKADSLPKETEGYDEQIKKLAAEETELLANAYDGFMAAFSNESFPMCGMDEITVTYLLADLARRTGKLEEASRWVSKVLTNRQAKERIKDKARDIKELIVQAKEKK